MRKYGLLLLSSKEFFAQFVHGVKSGTENYPYSLPVLILRNQRIELGTSVKCACPELPILRKQDFYFDIANKAAGVETVSIDGVLIAHARSRTTLLRYDAAGLQIPLQ